MFYLGTHWAPSKFIISHSIRIFSHFFKLFKKTKLHGRKLLLSGLKNDKMQQNTKYSHCVFFKFQCCTWHSWKSTIATGWARIGWPRRSLITLPRQKKISKKNWSTIEYKKPGTTNSKVSDILLEKFRLYNILTHLTACLLTNTIQRSRGKLKE